MMPELDPWGSSDIEDYAKLFDEFGIQPFEEILGSIEDPHMLMRRKIVFGHRDLERVLDAKRKGERFALVSGMMPSGKMHFGHKMVVDQLMWWQNLGTPLYIPIASVEAYGVREKSLDEVERLGIEEYLVNYIALGLRPEKCTVYFQEKRRAVDTLSLLFSRRVTFNELRAIYGELSPAKIVSALVQVGDILHPQLPEYEGPCPVVVPVGADQDPHIRLTRDIASRASSEFGFQPCAATYHRFNSGLDGGKMSSSKSSSYIALTETLKDARYKLMNAFTGGRDTLKEQKELGGRPEICTVYELMKLHLEPDDAKLEGTFHTCAAGELMCGDCKKRAWELLERFLVEHQENREKARDHIDEYLAKE